MTTEPTVFIVDDDGAFRDSLQFLLHSNGLAAEGFANGDAFLATFDPARPGCVLLDIRMPGTSGLETQERLRERGCARPILVITAHGDVATAVRALKAGAFDFIEKPYADHHMLARVREALAKDADGHEQQVKIAELARRLQALTPREDQVFRLVVSGKPNKVVAGDLGLSQKTIEVHRSNVMIKMEAETFADLVRISVALEQAGLFDPGKA